MKAITIWQPWASLIMVGAKSYEFRPKSYLRYVGAPAIGERIVIHAGARSVEGAEIEDLLERLDDTANSTALIPAVARQVLERCKPRQGTRRFRSAAASARPFSGARSMPAGSSAAPSLTAIAAIDEDAYNWAWPLSDIKPFDAPIPMRGAQGFWLWPEKIAA